MRVHMFRVLAAVLAAAAVACSGPSVTGAEIAALRVQARDVSRLQQAADADLAAALTAIRELDRVVAALRRPQEVDAVRKHWPRVEDAVAAADPENLRDALVELAVEVDAARVTLRGLRDAYREGWQARYLDAEDRVLEAVRVYAEAADGLARAVISSWPVYREVHDRTAAFIGRRWYYRSPQEAADAYEVEVGSLLDDLAAAQRAVAAALDVRDAQAERVNTVAARASAVWAQRPPRDHDGR